MPFIIVTRDPNDSTQAPLRLDTATPTVPPTETPTLTASPIPPTSVIPTLATPDASTPSPARPYYVLYATVDYDNHHAIIDEAIAYPNRTGVILNELVLAVEPMLYANAFFLTSISVDQIPVTNYSLESHRLAIPLSEPLPSGDQVNLVIQYELNIPVKQKGNTFGWLDRQTNLTEWYPFVVPYDPSAGWLLYDFMPWGEHLTYDSADFEVNLRFTDPASAPIIAAPALPDPVGEWTRYMLNGARTFALSMSREFLVAESAVGSVQTRSYYFAGHEDAGAKLSYVATQVVGLFDPLIAPYPYPVINVVELDYNDGMEFDGLCFLSSAFYDGYDGTSQNNLVVLGAHEMMHNWWFGLVGNDQAMEPWLDEALSVYSERIFFEYTNPGLVDWWWRFRVNYFKPRGYVDSTIYNSGSFRDYTDAVYFNGATFIEDVRARIGDQAFFAFIKDYAGQMSYRRATAGDFFRILRDHATEDISDLVAAYFAEGH